ncbi:ABC transporter permease [Paenibacillus apiarius]|uniref:ABC transporter permease n=1 Tax=Paenibacillus apiarius TaxID=46240 RepID=A0ABT4DTZ6_9BACL|nr:ABC transporter permease [Paenibacillus apiarius]MCY9516219.1 ABC transporter permease [Paenibacillus apiarius]MCY9519753.1 ABC transporter permease [Paenibacillus apiarius]MCY9555279.1 ABC transporter permease [Paenibacillus apiarius]MCY9559362.1 ABC transporter permease [Paenibacillus apiarius]MCY9682721.1 ABC transporter permease [Paenibacillus apiarius]
MIGKVLSSDFMKIRRTWIWLLIFLGPFGVVSLQAINFSLRYDYLTKLYADDLWGGLLNNVQYLAAPALLFGITLIASMIAGLEHRLNSWKQLLALPVSRFHVFTAKFALNLILLFGACVLLAAGSILLGAGLGFGWDIPWPRLFIISFYPFFAAMPVLAVQLWLSIVMRNQAIPLTCGIMGTILSLYSIKMPDWMPLKWPHLVNAADVPEYSVLAGLAAGAVIYAASLVHFARRDVN